MGSSLKRNALVLLLLSLLSKGLAFLREILLAYYFGVGLLLDAFNTGTAFSNSLLFIFSGGAFIPLLISFVVSAEKKEERKGLNGFLIFLFALSVILSMSVVFFSPHLVSNVAPSIKDQVVTVLQITAFSSAFYALSSIIRAYLNAKNEYTLSGAQDFVMIGVILGGIVLSQSSNNPLEVLSYTFLISSIFRVIVQLPALYHHRKEIFVGVVFEKQHIYRYTNLLFPMVFATLIPQIMVITTRLISSHMGEGVVSALSYADRTSDLIKSIVAYSLGAVLVTPFAKYLTNGQKEKFFDLLNKSLLFSFFVSLPLFFIFLLWGQEIVQIIYQRGSFNLEATIITGRALSYYSIATLFSSPIFILMYAMYSMKSWKGVLFSTSISVIFGILFMYTTYSTLGIIGVTLGLGIYSLTAFIALYLTILRVNDLKFSKVFNLGLLKLVLVNLLTFITGYMLYIVNPVLIVIIPFIYILLSHKFKETTITEVFSLIRKGVEKVVNGIKRK